MFTIMKLIVNKSSYSLKKGDEIYERNFFMTAQEVADILGVSKGLGLAYKTLVL